MVNGMRASECWARAHRQRRVCAPTCATRGTLATCCWFRPRFHDVPCNVGTAAQSSATSAIAKTIAVVGQHYSHAATQLLYTGVTRGKPLVVLVGRRKAMAIAVRGVSGRRCWSKLHEWLRAFDPDIRTDDNAAEGRSRKKASVTGENAWPYHRRSEAIATSKNAPLRL